MKFESKNLKGEETLNNELNSKWWNENPMTYDWDKNITESYLTKEYDKITTRGAENNNQIVRLSMARVLFMSAIPRTALEGLGFMLLSIIFLFNLEFILNATSITSLLAIGFGLQRIIPLGQQVYAGYAGVKSKRSLLILLNSILEKQSNDYSKSITNPNDNIANNKQIIASLNNVSLVKSNNEIIFDSIYLNIFKGDFVLIKGESGSGKTTLLDLLCGFIDSSSGDSKTFLQTNYSKIGLVNQDICLAEGSLIENIALTSEENLTPKNFTEINGLINSLGLQVLSERYKNNDSFININDRGANISGGQKQRIALARALFSIVGSVKISPMLPNDPFTETIISPTFIAPRALFFSTNDGSMDTT